MRKLKIINKYLKKIETNCSFTRLFVSWPFEDFLNFKKHFPSNYPQKLVELSPESPWEKKHELVEEIKARQHVLFGEINICLTNKAKFWVFWHHSEWGGVERHNCRWCLCLLWHGIKQMNEAPHTGDVFDL